MAPLYDWGGSRGRCSSRELWLTSESHYFFTNHGLNTDCVRYWTGDWELSGKQGTVQSLFPRVWFADMQCCHIRAVIEMSYQFEGRPVGQKPAQSVGLQPSVSLLGWYPCRLGFRSVRLVEVSREINK